MGNDISNNNAGFINNVSHEHKSAANIVSDDDAKKTQPERTPAQLKLEVSKLNNLFRKDTPSDIIVDDAQNLTNESSSNITGDKNHCAVEVNADAYYRFNANVNPQNTTANFFTQSYRTSLGITASVKNLNENLNQPGQPIDPNPAIMQSQTIELRQGISLDKNFISFSLLHTTSGAGSSNFIETISNKNDAYNLYTPPSLPPPPSAPKTNFADTSTDSIKASWSNQDLRTSAVYTGTVNPSGKMDSNLDVSSIIGQRLTPLINNTQQGSDLIAKMNAGQVDGLAHGKAELDFSRKKISYESATDQEGRTSMTKREQFLSNLNACLINSNQRIMRYDDNGNILSSATPTSTLNLNGSLSVNPSTSITGSYINSTNQGEPSSNFSNLNFYLKKQLDPTASIGLGYNESTSPLGSARTYSAAYMNTNNYTPLEVRVSKTIDPFNRSSSFASVDTPLGPKSSASFQHYSSAFLQTDTVSYNRKLLPNLIFSANGTRTTTSSGQQSDSIGIFLNGSFPINLDKRKKTEKLTRI